MWNFILITTKSKKSKTSEENNNKNQKKSDNPNSEESKPSNIFPMLTMAFVGYLFLEPFIGFLSESMYLTYTVSKYSIIKWE